MSSRPLLHLATLSLCPHLTERERDGEREKGGENYLRSLLIKALILSDQGSAFMTNYLPKALCPGIFTLCVGTSAYEFSKGRKYLAHSTI